MDVQLTKPTALDALAEELSKRTTKSERADRQLQVDLYTRILSLTEVNVSPYNIIRASAEILAQPELSAEDSVSNYSSIQLQRHNIWYHLIYDNLLPYWSHTGQDSKFSKFLYEITKNNPFYNVDYHLAETEFDKKSPDIMIFNKRDNRVLIGDITVTSNVTAARQRKFEKYARLVTFVESLGFKTGHVDFILAETLSNLDQQMRWLMDSRVVPYNVDYAVAKEYTISATSLMSMIKEMCRNKVKFAEVWDSAQKVKQFSISYSLLDGILSDDIRGDDFTAYEPTMSEDEVITMLKDQVDNVGGPNYFTHTIDDVNKAFDKIESDNKTKGKMPPKSTLKVVDCSHSFSAENDLELIESYLLDIAQADPCLEKEYVLSLLPTWGQLRLMKIARDRNYTRRNVIDDVDMKNAKVGGKYQFMRNTQFPNTLSNDLSVQLSKGKGEFSRNEKKEPKVVDMEDKFDHESFINRSMLYYGERSNKPPFLDDSWDAYNKLEEENTKVDKEVYDYCRSTNGAQLGNALSGLYDRITHMSTKLGSYDNVYIPPNGSFVALMPKEHAPVDRRTCDMPFVFMTRTRIGDPLSHIEHEHRLITKKHIYYIGKLCRLNVNKISCWNNAGHRLTACSSYIMTKCRGLFRCKEKTIGLLTYLILDVHQKVSEYLDLLKYVSFMPFADLHLLPLLVKDKCDLLMKTRMDAWIFLRLRKYINELSILPKLEAKKPVMQMQNGVVIDKSLGIELKLPSFIDPSIRHDDATEFIEEIGLLFTCRPKHLYGSQFLDESSTMTAQWNIDYDNEVVKYGNWAIDGTGPKGNFPFAAKFCFCADAIYYATIELECNIDATNSRVEKDLFDGGYGDFLHTNCSLRGCTKSHNERQNQDDMHTTSIDACLRKYEEVGFDNVKCRALYIGQEHMLSGDVMEFSMSEKDQRGGGRPIATPTLGTKAALMLIEKPEASLGKFMNNNILVAGKHKLSEQHKTYTETISHGVSLGLNEVYQLTEDQTKYSENDNPRKYEAYIRSSGMLSVDVRKLQMRALKGLYDRRHLLHRYPKMVEEDQKLVGETYTDNCTKAIRVRIGWPQGMLNNMSTTIHCAADYWIFRAFKKAYPHVRIHVRGLVHSDDSWAVVCCDSVEDFKLYAVFRLFAKKMFCLKMNEKKLWGGRYLGELVSNYNLNGNVHLATAKVISNGLSNLTYHNWPIDVSNQISTIQQAYRAGATLGNLVMLSTILRQQLLGAYHVDGLQKKHLYELPVELGGYPKCSVFKLAVGGVNTVYDELAARYNASKVDGALRIAVGASALTRETIEKEKAGKTKAGNKLDDYVEVTMPSRGEVFRGIKYLMPKSRKVKHALETIYRVTDKFPSDGLGMIVTKPHTIEESLGHLKDNVHNALYQLASERYTQNMRNLAISQSLQSSGKVVRVHNGPAMTINELLAYLSNVRYFDVDVTMLVDALEPESEVVWACTSIVNTAAVIPDNHHTRGNVINKMPDVDTIYDTVSPLKDVMLKIIDLANGPNNPTKLYEKYGSLKTCSETLTTDCNNIKDRFSKFFRFYDVVRACSLIMQNKINAVKEKTWIQPKIRYQSLSEFLEGLYGVTLNRDIRYKVHASREYLKGKGATTDMVRTLYTVEILNRVYPGKFVIKSIRGKDPKSALSQVDTKNLTRNDQLKNGVLQLVYNNNRDIIDKIYSNEQFVYKWLKAQKYDSRKKYYGNWNIIFKIGNLVCELLCQDGIIQVYVNRINLYLLLRGMRLVADRCFGKKYEYDTAWYLCPLWANARQPYKSTYYLKSWNHYQTGLTDNQEEGTIGIQLQPTLNLGFMVDETRPSEYILDPTLRVIGAKFDTPGVQETFRVASIFQDIDAPLRKDVALEYSELQGFRTSVLLKGGVIEDLIQSKPLSLSKTEIMGLLSGMGGIDTHGIVWKAGNQVLHRGMNLVAPRYPDLDIGYDEPEVVDIDLEFYGTQSMSEFSQNVKVETLEAVLMDYDSVVMKGQHRIRQVTNIPRALCSQYWGVITDKNVDDFVCRTMINPTIDHILSTMPNKTLRQLEENVEDLRGCINIPLELFSFIYGMGLDKNDYWDKFNGSVYTKFKRVQHPFASVNRLVDQFVSFIIDVSEVDEVPTPRLAIELIE